MTAEPKIIVLDDDPTGTQTVHGLYVYTDWSRETILAAFLDGHPMSYILTNSRSFSEEETIRVHREIGASVWSVSEELGRAFLLISRGDSTLRGHYPAETEALRNAIPGPIDGEVIIPFFQEGGRFTRDNIHYVRLGDALVPAAETEFARDVTFGYAHSHLGEWVQEKTGGRYRAEDCVYIPMGQDEDTTYRALLGVSGFAKVIVNAMEMRDLDVFARAVRRAMAEGKRFLFRTAAGFPKAIGHVTDRPLLTRGELVPADAAQGALVVVGSHVRTTTAQLAALLEGAENLYPIEFDASAALRSGGLAEEAAHALSRAEEAIVAGKTAVLYTSRALLVPEGGDREKALQLSVSISDALTGIVTSFRTRPAYLLAKGGITSSDVAVKGLGIRKALVAGQIRPGIPVWIAGEESKFPGLAYIVFPGNVGEPDTLRDIVRELSVIP